MPLTHERAKPAVPFGGRYRLIDFVLSNFINSGYFKIVVLTQYKSQSLNRHLSRAWRLSRALDQYVEPVPAQQRTGLDWYKGSADAIYQNLNLIADESPRDVSVFGADHIYKMEVSQMQRFHRKTEADLTIAAIPVPIEQASAFGVIEIDEDWRMIGFQEKPESPRPIPGDPAHALVSMGNYFFQREMLVDYILDDATDDDSAHDFGKSIIPAMLAAGEKVMVYDFSRNVVPGVGARERGYWRDVGSIESYYNASLDLIDVEPVIDLYNRHWPVRTDYQNLPPAKFVHAQADRVGVATESLVSEGSIISGGRISRSLLSPRTRINSYSRVEGCIIFENVEVGRFCRLRRVIVDKHVEIPPGTEIGYDSKVDRERGLHVSPDGIVVVPKGFTFE